MAVKLSLTPGDPDTLVHDLAVRARTEAAQARVARTNKERYMHTARSNAFLQAVEQADAAMRSAAEGCAVEVRQAEDIIGELVQ